MDKTQANAWLSNAKNELNEIQEKLDLLDLQGRIDVSLATKATELRKNIENFERLFNE